MPSDRCAACATKGTGYIHTCRLAGTFEVPPPPETPHPRYWCRWCGKEIFLPPWSPEWTHDHGHACRTGTARLAEPGQLTPETPQRTTVPTIPCWNCGRPVAYIGNDTWMHVQESCGKNAHPGCAVDLLTVALARAYSGARDDVDALTAERDAVEARRDRLAADFRVMVARAEQAEANSARNSSLYDIAVEALQKAEVERDVWSGQACRDEQAAGNGPCGACRYCLPGMLKAAEAERDAARKPYPGTCRPTMPHLRPCGPVPGDDSECACGCDAAEGWCYQYAVEERDAAVARAVAAEQARREDAAERVGELRGLITERDRLACLLEGEREHHRRTQVTLGETQQERDRLARENAALRDSLAEAMAQVRLALTPKPEEEPRGCVKGAST